jgi:hypothetical protein
VKIIENHSNFVVARIYPFLKTEDQPHQGDFLIIVGRTHEGERVTVHLEDADVDMTHRETLELIKALKLAAKLAQVYTDVP